MLQSIMDTNERPNSPLMRKLQEALESELNLAAQAPMVAAIQNNPLRTQPATAAQTTRIPPAIVPRPQFTSAAISKGDYVDPPLVSESSDPAFAEEDLSEAELNANGRSRRGSLILASSVILAGAAAIAAFIFILSPQQGELGPIPEIVASPDSGKVAPDPVADLRTIEPAAATQVAPPVSMGEVSSELVAPTTDGLSPARRISTTRILLDGDKEILP